jgi:hypothetical protein
MIMKKTILLTALMAVFLAFTGCEKDLPGEIPESITLKAGHQGNAALTGFDQWGYNWKAHHFNGYLINAWFGDEMDPSAPWYKKEPPFEGDVMAYQEAHPEVLEYPFWGYGDMKMVSHWNEASISSEGVYAEDIRDTDAWITFHYSQGEGQNRWSQFQKYVAVKSTDELVVYFADPVTGDPIYGEWFSATGEAVGLFYLWPDRALIQVVNTGNLPDGFLPIYKSPMGPGLGSHASR